METLTFSLLYSPIYSQGVAWLREYLLNMWVNEWMKEWMFLLFHVLIKWDYTQMFLCLEFRPYQFKWKWHSLIPPSTANLNKTVSHVSFWLLQSNILFDAREFFVLFYFPESLYSLSFYFLIRTSYRSDLIASLMTIPSRHIWSWILLVKCLSTLTTWVHLFISNIYKYVAVLYM